MDHSEALRLQAAEKYALGEMSTQLREEYEEHYFDCQECASELKATIAFVEGARTVLRGGTVAETEKQAARPQNAGLFGWLRPVVAVPVFATLLLVMGYQSLVTVPRLKRNQATTAQNADFLSLIGANSRSEGTKILQIHRERPTVLELDIPATDEFATYDCQVRDVSGHNVFENRVSRADAKRTVHLIVPHGRLQAGKYTLIVFAEGSVNSGAPRQTEIERLGFMVEFLP